MTAPHDQVNSFDGSFIVGHTHQRNSLSDLIKNGKLPSTLMFSGARGIGKLQVALEVARSILCEHNQPAGSSVTGSSRFTPGGCRHCRMCTAIARKSLPDLHILECLEKEEASTAALRELLYSLNLSIFSGSARIVIFNDAEYLSNQSANLLLKTLEEPRQSTYFFIITANPRKLPATVVSRCQTWFFDALSVGEIELVLSHRERTASGDSPARAVPRAELALLADGSLDNLDKVAASYDQWIEIKESLARILEGAVDFSVEYAQKLAKDKEALRHILQLVRIRARQQMHTPIGTEEERPRLLRRWASLLSDAIMAEHFIFERNFSPYLVLVMMFLRFCDEAHLCYATSLPVLQEIVV